MFCLNHEKPLYNITRTTHGHTASRQGMRVSYIYIQLDIHIFTDCMWLVVKYAVVCVTLQLPWSFVAQPSHSPAHTVVYSQLTNTGYAKHLLNCLAWTT